MPTPVGHALAGLSTAWLSESAASRSRSSRLAAACVMAATAADLDILIHQHRLYMHSIGAAAIVAAGVWLMARRREGTSASARFLAVTIGSAYATHILLDWLGKDTAFPYGLMALWPFSSGFYISGADVFMEISRRYWKPDEFYLGNAKAVALEIAILGPVTAISFVLNRFLSSRPHLRARRH